MPIHDEAAAFLRDYRRLTSAQRARFHKALNHFIADLQAMETGKRSWFRPSLRVKPVRTTPGLYEMSWAPDTEGLRSHGATLEPKDSCTYNGTAAALTASYHNRSPR